MSSSRFGLAGWILILFWLQGSLFFLKCFVLFCLPLDQPVLCCSMLSCYFLSGRVLSQKVFKVTKLNLKNYCTHLAHLKHMLQQDLPHIYLTLLCQEKLQFHLSTERFTFRLRVARRGPRPDHLLLIVSRFNSHRIFTQSNSRRVI